MTSCNGDAVTSRSPVLDPRKNETLDVVTSKIVDTMMSEVIGDLRISLNKPLESADYCYTGLLKNIINTCRFQWPRGLRRRSAAARLPRLWVRVPPAAWMFVCCECCVLLGRGLCNELITRPEEFYRLWCFVVCDLETS